MYSNDNVNNYTEFSVKYINVRHKLNENIKDEIYVEDEFNNIISENLKNNIELINKSINNKIDELNNNKSKNEVEAQ